MAFCFNFQSENCIDIANEQCDRHCEMKENSVNHCNETDDCSFPCEIIPVSAKSLMDFKFTEIQVGSSNIKYVQPPSVIPNSEDLKLIELSDLVEGVYEGGLKVWECAVDLLNFLHENKCIEPNIEVLELGCGAGLPGLFAFKCGALVTFQDFNEEVLQLVTIPNALLNSSNGSNGVKEKCTFIKGDWDAVKKKLYVESVEKKLFDVILTSETIYNKRNYKKLLELFKCALKPNGIIYLAAKIYYFGVGGGITDFEEFVDKDNIFNIQTLYKISDGVERRILSLKFKN